MISAIFPENFRPQFSGHETFPLRQLWLLKFSQLINDIQNGVVGKPSDEDAICILGVGKNMLNSMRYWAQASGMAEQTPTGMKLTKLGKLIFGTSRRGEHGLDESCEHSATQWLVHWNLSATPVHFTTNWFLFNCINTPTIDREVFLKKLKEWTDENSFKTSLMTLKRSIEVVLRSYVPRQTGRGHMEDFIEPLLADLDLLRVESRDVIEFHRAAHPSLPDGLFAYALMDYWSRQTAGSTLDFNHIAFDYGSPGRVFKLDAKSIDGRLSRLEELTNEALVWTEQAGLRQVIRRNIALKNPEEFKTMMLKKAYEA